MLIHGLWLSAASVAIDPAPFRGVLPWSIAHASYKQQKRHEGVTEIVKIAGGGHSLTIDHGWREVSDTSLAFVQRFVKP